jgi:hypothetical protein
LHVYKTVGIPAVNLHDYRSVYGILLAIKMLRHIGFLYNFVLVLMVMVYFFRHCRPAREKRTYTPAE